MRFGGAIILVLGLCLPGAADVAANGAADPGLPQFIPTTPPRPVPEVTVETRTGEKVRLTDLKGHPLLINFWATWCGPCISEMPALDALAAERAGTPLMIMAVSEDRKGESVVAPFLKKLRLTSLPIYLDPETKALAAFGSDALPTTVLIDRNGREIGRLMGAASWDSVAARRLIDRLLSPNPPDTWSAMR
jgi:thiol-disulfide isomerase/thioredoxin